MEAPLEQALLENNLVTHHTILKVGHHGSKSSTSQIFLDQVAPEVALVSVGTKNRYGHPSTLVLDRLRTAEVHSVLRTDEMGTVELITDGQRVWRRPR
jgi:competence protein ComEC